MRHLYHCCRERIMNRGSFVDVVKQFMHTLDAIDRREV